MESEDELRQLQVGIAASGNMKPQDFKKYTGQLVKAARGKKRARPARGRDLKGMNIKVAESPRKEE